MTARRGDRLQTGDTGAHDEDARGRNGTGGGHHHRQRTVVFRSAIDHGLIAGEVRLGRQNVHDLRTGNPRHEFHGEGGNAGRCHRFHVFLMAKGIHDRKNKSVFFHELELIDTRATDLQDNIRVAKRGGGVRCDLRTGVLEFTVQNTGSLTGPLLHNHLETKPDELLHRISGGSHPCFDGVALERHPDFHKNPSDDIL